MAKKQYLEKAELAVLIQYINDSLESKVNIGEIPEAEIPDNLVNTTDLASALIDYVKASELNNYAKKNEVVSELPADLVYESELDDYAPLSALDSYALASDLQTLEGRLNGIYHFKGSVANLEELQAVENPVIGDVYNLEDTGMNAAWTGEMWDEFGTIVDLSGYVKAEDVQDITRAELNAMLYSGKSAVVANIDAFKAMVANDEPEVEITLNKDVALADNFVIPTDKKVTLDLGDNKMSIASGKQIQVQGELVIEAGEDGEVDAGSWGFTAYGENAKIVLNSGHLEAGEAPICVQQGAQFIMNGGELEGRDNCPIMGQGNAGQGDVDIVMNGGKLIAHITSAGYQACGIYMPNSGKFTMNGGEIISDGAGIVMRCGEVELNGGSITANGTSGILGKVGDSQITVGPYAVVYDEKANYPALQAGNTMKLTIGADMILSGTDGDISILMPDGKDIAEANIIDNREETQTEP